jgi:hypothetical protein
VAALFASAGVIRVETLAQLFDVGTLLAHQPLPAGDRVAVVGNSTAMGWLVSDAVLEQGMRLAHEAPTDIGAGGSAEEFRTALQGAVGDEGVDAVVAVFLPPVSRGSAEFGRALREVAVGADKPIVATFLSTEGIPAELVLPGEDGTPARGSVPSFSTPERAVIALAKVAQYAAWRRRPVGEVPSSRGRRGRPRGTSSVRRWPRHRRAGADRRRSSSRCWPPTASRCWAPARSPTRGRRSPRPRRSATRSCSSRRPRGCGTAPTSAGCAGPHRRRRGARGVRGDPVGRPGDRAGDGRARGGHGRGDRRRPVFGALVSFGLGGVATDLLGDRAYRTLPLTDLDAAELVRAPRAWPLLNGYRGSEPVDVPALEDLLLRVARLADDLPEVLRLTLEPVIVGPPNPWHGGRSLVVAGAAARVGPPTGRVDPGPRRMRSPM